MINLVLYFLGALALLWLVGAIGMTRYERQHPLPPVVRRRKSRAART